MSVLSHELSWSGASGSFTGDASSWTGEYSAGYKFTTSSALDGPKKIRDYCQPNGDSRPWLGKEYRYGNDVDVDSICTKITPTKDTVVPTLWIVVAEYTPKKSPNGQDVKQPNANGEDTTNPLEWAPQCTSRSMQVAVPVDKAKFLGGMKGKSLAAWPVGKIGPVVNSALIPYNPPLETERDIGIYTFTFYLSGYNAKYWGGLRGAINSDTVAFTENWFQFVDSWEPYTAKIKNADGQFKFQNGYKYWEITLEIHHDPLGWDRHILDAGTTLGGVIDPDDDRTPSIGDLLAVPEVVLNRWVVGVDGLPVGENIPFDGTGVPLRNPTADNRIYLDYRVNLNETPFMPIFGLFL